MKRKLALLLSILTVATSVLTSHSFYSNMLSTEASSYDIDEYLDMSQLEGYATVEAFGMDTVTGGGNATPQVVTTTDQFINAVSNDTPAVILVSGTITCMTSTGGAVNIGSNKTIVGINENATLNGGINISGKSNIIVSNLIMKGFLKQSRTPDDVINVQNGSHHIWFNHLDISDGGDGNLDIKGGSDYITVSWCKFYYTDSSHDHRLSCLIGSGAGDHDDTDYNRLHVTYHHNWFADYVKDRQPRVMYGRVHVYNNYYTCSNNSYCVGVDCYGAALIENCYFYKVKNPHQFMYDTNTMPASITARGNIYDQTSGTKATGDAPDKLGVVEPLENAPYAYWLDDAKNVPDIVQAYAGPVAIDPNATPHPTAAPTAKPVTTAVPTARPTNKPTASPAPAKNDNPATYVTDSTMGKVIQFNGQSSDGTNGYMEISNPFAGKDFSETPKYSGVYPVWTKGVTISYWQYIPSGVNTEGVAISFNGTHRAIRDVDYIWYKDGETLGYQNRFEDNGGTYSLIREGNVRGGLQFSTYASVAFSEDDMTAMQINPYSGEYGYTSIFQDKNYFYYFANGGTYTNSSGSKSALVSSKGKWHHVAHVITNDDIITYVDGSALGVDYFNYWGSSISSKGTYCNGQAFNLGTGWSKARRYSSDSECYKHGMTLLDFLSHENTTLCVGGVAYTRDLGQSGYTTPAGVKIGKLGFYDEPLTVTEVKALYNGTEPDADTAPTKAPEATAIPTTKPTATPTPKPTATPTVAPTATPTPKPTATPTVAPTATPSSSGALEALPIGVKNDNGVATVSGTKIVFKDPTGYSNGVILENPFIGKDTSKGAAISFWLTPAQTISGKLYDYTSMIVAVRSDLNQELKFDLEGTRQLSTENGPKLNYWEASTSLENAKAYYITLVINENGLDYYVNGKNIGYSGYSEKEEAAGRTQALTLLATEGTTLYAGGTTNIIASMQELTKHKLPEGTIIKDVTGYIGSIDASVVASLYEAALNPSVTPTSTPTVAPTATPTAKPTATPTATPTAAPAVTDAPDSGDEIPFSGRFIIAGDSIADGVEGTDGIGWGDVVHENFTTDVTVRNEAHLGDSCLSYFYDWDGNGDSHGRWQNAYWCETWKNHSHSQSTHDSDDDHLGKNDYIIISFGHNDANTAANRYASATAPTTEKGSFKWWLKEKYIDPALSVGAVPILMTPIVRCTYDSNGKYTETATHLSYGQAMRDLVAEYAAKGTEIMLIDAQQYTYDTLSNMTKEEASKLYASGGTTDVTHMNAKGAAWLADYVCAQLLTYNLGINEYIIDSGVVAPTATPTVAPTATPTATPTAAPTPKPTATPTPKPTATPTAKPTATPTAKPTATPTAKPTATPTATPTAMPTPTPTATPTASPTVEPMATPTASPTATPTATPTTEPTATPEPTHSETPSETQKPEYVLGDVNEDGFIDATDALLVLKCAARLDDLSDNQKLAADTSFDKAIDATDALLILKYAARLIEGFVK